MNIIHKIAVVLLIGVISCKGKNNNHSVSEKQSEPDINKVSLTDLVAFHKKFNNIKVALTINNTEQVCK